MNIKQFIKFAACTFVAYMADALVFAALYNSVGDLRIFFKAVSYVTGLIVSYSLNRKFTFLSKSPYVSGTLGRFLLLNCVSLTVSLTTLWLFCEIWLLPVWAGYLLSGVCSFSVNYLGNTFFVFGKGRS